MVIRPGRTVHGGGGGGRGVQPRGGRCVLDRGRAGERRTTKEMIDPVCSANISSLWLCVVPTELNRVVSDAQPKRWSTLSALRACYLFGCAVWTAAALVQAAQQIATLPPARRTLSAHVFHCPRREWPVRNLPRQPNNAGGRADVGGAGGGRLRRARLANETVILLTSPLHSY